ncbi:CRISPR-associated helicase Cas3/CRISPR-associated endonuclease Cas3-HD [Opitutaceae bacterium TAV1]|nr:CRISPR-associated helicase Cas3/CRISPR-associated endonuclease Cas3-HD [Opitutaceae bacterium TAV1]
MPCYAHSLSSPDGQPLAVDQWELLWSGDPQRPGHLEAVASLAEQFAGKFGAAEWARLLGLWHDLGKFSAEFQAYLRSAGGAEAHLEERPAVASRVDHSTAGAQFAAEALGAAGLLLAYLIAGHHAGLPNGRDGTSPGGSLDGRLEKTIPDWRSATPECVLKEIIRNRLVLPDYSARSGASMAFFLRMLFSCLVDADFLCTEAFMNPEQAQVRPTQAQSMAGLDECLTRYMAEKFGVPVTPVHHARAGVLQACLDAATKRPGLFSLTVPTGGGKTLASLAFALRHAKAHGMERVIYVIPFTSIIEQNARVFREALAGCGVEVVLEHHSNLDPDAQHVTRTSRLASENWDMSVVVTTNVQFFESLHANGTSRCRKLHRMARSVIILDEAQTLPVTYLATCLHTLEQLATNYGSSVVLCTATQPFVVRRPEFPIGLPEPVEIIPEPTKLYTTLKRVEVKPVGKLTDAELLDRLKAHRQVLCIVNTRRHAAELYAALPAKCGRIHLSAQMCPEHRSVVIDKIRSGLVVGEPCVVISTQLIEAGVDLDFPVAYRALAGLDSIAQAAGRCNREGRLARGVTYVFEPERRPPAGFLRQTAQTCAQILELHDDLLSLDAVRHYFELHYWERQAETDARGILACWPKQVRTKDDLLSFEFKKAAEAFQFIESAQQAVIVPWGGKGKALCAELRKTFEPRAQRLLGRRLQRFIVQIPDPIFRRQLGTSVEMIHERFPLLVSELDYSEELGLQFHSETPYDSESLMCS